MYDFFHKVLEDRKMFQVNHKIHIDRHTNNRYLRHKIWSSHVKKAQNFFK